MPSFSDTRKALEKLRRAREGVEKRIDQHHAVVEDIYEEVSEEQYQQMQEERKRKGSFVVGDETGEYEDDGEDHWDSEFYESDLVEPPGKKARTAAGKAAQKKAAAKAPGKLASLFSSTRKNAPKTVTAAPAIPLGGGDRTRRRAAATAVGAAALAAANAEMTEDPDLQSLLQDPLRDGLNAASAAASLVRLNPDAAAAAAQSRPAPSKQKRGGSFVAPTKTKSSASYTEIAPKPEPATTTPSSAASAAIDTKTPQAPQADDVPMLEIDAAAAALFHEEPATVKAPTEAAAAPQAAPAPSTGAEAKPSVVVSPAPPSSATAPHQGEPVPLDKDGNLAFYWLDAAENVAPKKAGTVYLLGKVQLPSGQFASCCVAVNNVPKVLYAVPREPVLDSELQPTEYFGAVMEELQSTLRGAGTLRCKPVLRNYAFDAEDVPYGSSSFVKVKLDAGAAVPSGASGKTFVRLLGASAGPLEQLILKARLRGPEWLLLRRPAVQTARVSWCAMEVSVDDYKALEHVSGGPSVPLTLLGLSLKTAVRPGKHEAEVVAATLCCQPGVDVDGAADGGRGGATYAAVMRLGPPLPLDFVRRCRGVVQCATTRDMLAFIFGTLGATDPDVLVGHDIAARDLDVLLHLAKAAGDSTAWSRLGRLRLSALSARPRYLSPAVACRGRLVCDTYVMAQELVKHKTYKLPELAAALLGEPGHAALEPADVPALFASADGLQRLLAQNERDARLAMRLAAHMRVLSLTRQLTGIAGNLWARTLAGNRADRIEYLLLHEFHDKKFVVPEKRAAAARAGAGAGADAEAAGGRRKKAAYKGGMVLNAKVGFYDKMVVLLDFKSLYPSIIQEFNICFTTVKRLPSSDSNNSNSSSGAARWTAAEPERGAPEGILPRVLRSLVQQRSAVRSRMAKTTDAAAAAALNIRQSALKLIANSLYGCLGFEHSRFYARPLAELVTRKGRETLEKSQRVAEEKGLRVIYGDTDSLMLYAGCDTLDEARELGTRVLTAINQEYRALELELEAVYSRLLLLKKKNYACVDAATGKRTVKGLYIVRRDWCDLARDAGSFVLDQLLTATVSRDDVPERIYTYLTDLAQRARAGAVPLDKYGITKQLSKDPQQYGDTKSQPHAAAALRFRKEEGGQVAAGDFVTYVVCKPQQQQQEQQEQQQQQQDGGGTAASAAAAEQESAASNAYMLETVRKKSPQLQPNVEWYLAAQVLPPLVRLCEPVADIEAAHLAECLGLDPAKHGAARAHGSGAAGGGEDAGGALDDEAADKVLRGLHDFASEALRHLHRSSFECCEDLLVHCPYACCAGQSPFVFKGLLYPLADDAAAYPAAALECPRCHRPFGADAVGNQVVCFVRSRVRMLYSGSCVCDSETCRHVTRVPVLRREPAADGSVRVALCCPVCASPAVRMYDERALYYQLMLLRSMFDLGSHSSSLAMRLTAEQRAFFNTVAARLAPFIQQCALHFVSLASLQS